MYQKAFADYIATGSITLMEYKKGWVLNSWAPEEIDGFLTSNYERVPLPTVWKSQAITFYPSSKGSTSGTCRVTYNKLKGYWYYVDRWAEDKGKRFEWDDYLKFSCRKN